MDHVWRELFVSIHILLPREGEGPGSELGQIYVSLGSLVSIQGLSMLWRERELVCVCVSVCVRVCVYTCVRLCVYVCVCACVYQSREKGLWCLCYLGRLVKLLQA